MSGSITWTRQKLFDPEEVKRMVKTPLPLKARLILPLLANRYAVEDKVMIRYKKYKGVIYVLEIIDL